MHLKLSKLANTRKFTIDIKNRKNCKSEKKTVIFQFVLFLASWKILYIYLYRKNIIYLNINIIK
jgi:hypothetical protein